MIGSLTGYLSSSPQGNSQGLCVRDSEGWQLRPLPAARSCGTASGAARPWPPGFVVPDEGPGPGHWLGDAVAYFFLKMQILFLAGVLNL